MKADLNNIITFTKKINAVKCFYADVLGPEVIGEINSGWVLLHTGSCKIGFATEKARKGIHSG